MLAIAESERLAAAGHRVLLCCANGRLANDLSVALANHERIEVSGAYELATSLVASAGAMDRVPPARSEEVLEIHLPEIACEVLPESRRGRYTALVLDEAQDLVSPRWLDLFGSLLEGGLEQGCWRLFLDPNQDLILGSNPQSVERLDDATESRYRLSKNCRNTREVATATAMLTGLGTLDTLKVAGPAIEEHWYRSREQQRELAASILRDWIHDGLVPRRSPCCRIFPSFEARSTASESMSSVRAWPMSPLPAHSRTTRSASPRSTISRASRPTPSYSQTSTI